MIIYGVRIFIKRKKSLPRCQSFIQDSPVLMIDGDWTHITVLPVLTFSWILVGRSGEEGDDSKILILIRFS